MNEFGEQSEEFKDLTNKIATTNIYLYENAMKVDENDEKWRKALEDVNEKYAKDVFDIIDGYFTTTVQYLVELYKMQSIHLCDHCLSKHLDELEQPFKDEDDFIFVEDYPEYVFAKYLAYSTELKERILFEEEYVEEAEDNNKKTDYDKYHDVKVKKDAEKYSYSNDDNNNKTSDDSKPKTKKKQDKKKKEKK